MHPCSRSDGSPTSHPKLRTNLTLFYISGSLAALFGGTVHGFLPNPRSPAHRILWRLTLLTIGLTALATETVASHLLGSKSGRQGSPLPGTAPILGAAGRSPADLGRPVVSAPAGLRCSAALRAAADGTPALRANLSLRKLVLYTLAIIARPTHTLALLNGLLATSFLLIALFTLWLRTRARAALLGPAAIALAILAAGVQQARIALQRRYFDHNVLYHLIQGLSMLIFYRAARRLVALP